MKGVLPESNSPANNIPRLLSTLGTKSAHRRITRREIQAVSIPQTCGAIKKPEEGLTLRLSSSLLYGVALVYRQKTDFLNNDAAHVRMTLQRDASHQSTSTHRLTLPFGMHRHTAIAAQFLMDDPTFALELLPSMTELEMGDDNEAPLQLRLAIRDDDAKNDLFTGDVEIIDGLLNEDVDELGNLDPEFSFNDDGFLLDLNIDTTAGDNGFDVDFDIAMDDTRADDNMQMEQILEEIEPLEHVEPMSEPAVIGTSRKRIRLEYAPVIVDVSISLSTDDLREFRDNYVELMQGRRQKKCKPPLDIHHLMNDPLLPTFAIDRSHEIETPRGRSEDPNHRRRSSVDSIETGRNASSRRHSRGSITGINIPFEGFDDLGDNDIDVDMGRRSSSIDKLPELEEEQLEVPLPEPPQIATGEFLSFIRTKFKHSGQLTFAELIDFEVDRRIVVRSFYEVLQLTTLGDLTIINEMTMGLKTASDFALALKV